MDTGRDLSMIVDVATVVHAAAHIQDSVGADYAARIYNHPRTNNRTRTNPHIGRNHCRWVPGGDKAFALALQLVEQALAGTIVPDRDNQGIVGHMSNIGGTPQDWETKHRATIHIGTIIQTTYELDPLACVTRPHQGVGHDLRVPTTTKDEHIHFRPGIKPSVIHHAPHHVQRCP
jgi:hypothetical protein